MQILSFFLKNGRGGEIRTHDLLYPKQARYQATLRPDLRGNKICLHSTGKAMMKFVETEIGLLKSG